jgi:hypothetical protein
MNDEPMNDKPMTKTNWSLPVTEQFDYRDWPPLTCYGEGLLRGGASGLFL